MRKIKCILTPVLSVLTAACFASGLVLSSGTLQPSVTAETAGLENVTGQYETEHLRKSLMNSDLLSQKDYPSDKLFWIFVDLKGESLTEARGSSSRSIAEYAESAQGSAQEKRIAAEQERFLKQLDRVGIDYTYKYSYSVFKNAVGIRVRYGDISRICSLDGVAGVAVSEHYAAPKSVTTNETFVWNTGIYKTEGIEYTGEGTIVAVLDTGFDVSHEAFSVMPDEETVARTKDDVESMIFDGSGKGLLQFDNSVTVDDVYYNAKVPFAYDYADKDADVFPSYSTHGTHVAGIIAGNSVDEVLDNDGNPILDDYGEPLKFVGVAPEAQLAICKVFTDDDQSMALGGAETVDILAALEDCAKLGVDVINMSLGSSAGFSSDGDAYTQEVYSALREEGISLVVAASNDYSSGYGGPTGTNLTSDPDSGTVGSPSTYPEALSVASIEGQPAPYMLGNKGTEYETYAYFTNAADGNGNPQNFLDEMFKKFGDRVSKDGILEMEYVSIPGYGRSSNYIGLNVTGKIALVSRGGDVSFEEKMSTAKQRGAAACIIYNNVTGTVQMSLGEDKNPIPTCSVTMEIGRQLAAGASGSGRTGKLLLSRDYKAGPFMSSFSSWGPTPSLELKPEITAHGGEITSSVPGGWAEYSGTSMATPNMAGAMALILHHLRVTQPELSESDRLTLAYQEVMSTATIALNEFGDPYSPRKQGAGLANIKNAIDTQAYVSVEGTDKAKIELGDDPERKGVYTMTFTLNNLSDRERRYDLSLDVFSETVASDNRTVAERAYMLNDRSSYTVTADGTEVKDGRIVLEAGGTASVTLTLTLDASAKAYLDDNFENGMYVEGFIYLSDVTGDAAEIDLNIPYLAFYGDWFDAPMFDYDKFEMAQIMQDDSIPDDEKPTESIFLTQPLGTYYNDEYLIPLGEYVYELPEGYDEMYADTDKCAISMYDSEYNHTVYELYCIYAGMLRAAKHMELEIKDAVTGEGVYYENRANVSKAYAAGGSINPSMIKLEFNPADLNLSNNRSYVFTMNGTLDSALGREDTVQREENTFSFTFNIDTQAPEVRGYKIRFEPYTEDKETKYNVFLDLEVYDNQYAQSVLLCYLDEEKDEVCLLTGYAEPVRGGKNSVTTVSMDITEYYDDIDEIFVQVDDYALNASLYKLTTGGKYAEQGMQDLSDAIEFPDEISFAQEEITLNINEVAQLTPEIRPADASPTGYYWTSNRPAVAEVKDGEVIGRSEGTALITVYAASSADRSRPYAEIFVKVTGEEDPLPTIESLRFGLIVSENDSMQDATNATVKVHPNETIDLGLHVEPWYFPQDIQVTYTSTRPDIASVDENGIVRTLKEGSTTVRATYQGEYQPYTVSVTLAVGSDFYVEGGILRSYHGTGGTVVVPRDLNVYYIDEEAFTGNDYIEVLEISEPCSDIREGALSGMTALKRLILPETLTYVYTGAFADCPALETIELRSTAVTFGPDSFRGCVSLKTVRTVAVTDPALDMDVTSVISLSPDQIRYEAPRIGTVKTGAFAGCTALESIDLSLVRSVGAGAFEGCTALSEVTLSRYTPLAENMFKGCTSLSKIVYTDTDEFTFMSASAFAGCCITEVEFAGERYTVEDGAYYADEAKTELVWLMQDKTQFEVPAGVRIIGTGAFAGNERLNSVTFAEGSKLEKIGSYAFSGSGITEIDLPESVGFLGKGAFKNCASLTKADITCLVTELPDELFANSALSDVTFDGERITALANRVFYGTKLTSADLSDTAIVSMGDETFGACYDLVSVRMPKVTSLGRRTFSSALFVEDTSTGITQYQAYSSLETVSFPEGATTLGTETFYYEQPNVTLVTVHIPDSLSACIREIGAYLFYNCEYLAGVNLKDAVKVGEYAFYNCFSLGGHEGISSGLDLSKVTEVGDYAFYGCAFLGDHDLSSLKTIGDYAFTLTKRFERVSLPAAEHIGDYAFWLSNLNSVSIPEAVHIGAHAFGYTLLEGEFTVPASVTYIGEGAFTADPALTSVSLERAYDDYKTVDGVLFRVLEDGGLELLVYPAGKSGASYTVPDGTVRIGENAFDSASALTEITLPASLEAIGDKAFYRCGAKDFTFLGLSAPVLESKYVDPYDYDADTYEYLVFGAIGEGAIYYANFFDYLALQLYLEDNSFGLTLHYPENASGFDSPVYTDYFETVEKEAPVADALTKLAVSLLEEMPSVEQFEALKESKDTQLLAEYKAKVTAARRAFNDVSDPVQLSFISQELQDALIETERVMREVRSLLGDEPVVSKITVLKDPSKTVYTEGEVFDAEGLVLKVIYDDFSEIEVTEGFTYPEQPLTVNNSYVEISYDGAVTSVSIRVTASGDVGPGPVSPEEQGGLPAWAIVLICAGGVLVVGGAAAAVFLIARKKRNG